jgi:hypothetical protein
MHELTFSNYWKDFLDCETMKQISQDGERGKEGAELSATGPAPTGACSARRNLSLDRNWLR